MYLFWIFFFAVLCLIITGQQVSLCTDFISVFLCILSMHLIVDWREVRKSEKQQEAQSLWSQIFSLIDQSLSSFFLLPLSSFVSSVFFFHICKRSAHIHLGNELVSSPQTAANTIWNLAACCLSSSGCESFVEIRKSRCSSLCIYPLLMFPKLPVFQLGVIYFSQDKKIIRRSAVVSNRYDLTAGWESFRGKTERYFMCKCFVWTKLYSYSTTNCF